MLKFFIIFEGCVRDAKPSPIAVSHLSGITPVARPLLLREPTRDRVAHASWRARCDLPKRTAGFGGSHAGSDGNARSCGLAGIGSGFRRDRGPTAIPFLFPLHPW